MNPFVVAGIIVALLFGAFLLLAMSARSKQKQDMLDEKNRQEERARILREIEVKKLQDKREMERNLALNKARETTISLEKREPVPVRQTSRPLKPEAAKKSETRKVDDDDLYTGRNTFAQQSAFNRVDDTPVYNTPCAPEPTRHQSYSCPAPDTSSSYGSDSSSSDSGGGGGGGD
jgi:hypothetical protein